VSQNDLVIANQSAPDFRSDLNDALQALGSLNSGASAPSPTYANMLWYDTANNILKMRTEADDAWIDIGLLDQSSNKFFPENGVPTGTIIYHASASAPDGYLKANGAAVSRTTYSSLFTAIGTTWGAGDGSTTFNLPDLRGEFARGWDDGRGVDSGRSFASAQADEIKSHAHTPSSDNGFLTGSNSGTDFNFNYGSGSAVFTGGVNQTSSVGGDETRPRNIALLACIKF